MSDAATIAGMTPPGHFMCCICFGTFPAAEAVRWDAEGQSWDVCETDREAAGL